MCASDLTPSFTHFQAPVNPTPGSAPDPTFRCRPRPPTPAPDPAQLPAKRNLFSYDNDGFLLCIMVICNHFVPQVTESPWDSTGPSPASGSREQQLLEGAQESVRDGESIRCSTPVFSAGSPGSPPSLPASRSTEHRLRQPRVEGGGKSRSPRLGTGGPVSTPHHTSRRVPTRHPGRWLCGIWTTHSVLSEPRFLLRGIGSRAAPSCPARGVL